MKLGNGEITQYQLIVFKILAKRFGEFVHRDEIAKECEKVTGIYMNPISVMNHVFWIRKALSGTKYCVLNNDMKCYRLEFKNENHHI